MDQAPTALIIRAAGTNCEQELACAFTLAGAQAQLVHVKQLTEDPKPIDQAQLIGFPGGFSYGDDIAAGRILANRLRHRLMRPLQEASRRGVPMIGICNGFQVLAKMGLLPAVGGEPDAPAPDDQGQQRVTLADNLSGTFIDRWVSLRVTDDSRCVWTRGLGRIDLPIAHGEGRFVTISDATLNELRNQHQVALRYESTSDQDSDSRCVTPRLGNPNGSVDDIAGICDPTGLVLGLMPHPERYTHHTHHPQWTREGNVAYAQSAPPAGLQMFINAVQYASERSLVQVAG